MTRILIVDKDHGHAERLAALLRAADPTLRSATASSAHSAARAAAELEVDIVLVALGADPREGADTADAISSHCTTHRPVLVAVAADRRKQRRIIDEALFDHALCRPLRVAGLLGLIARCGAAPTAGVVQARAGAQEGARHR